MGTVNAITKQFMKRNEITADTFNFLLYNGEPVIHPDQLTELNSVAVDYLYNLPDSEDDSNSAESGANRSTI